MADEKFPRLFKAFSNSMSFKNPFSDSMYLKNFKVSTFAAYPGMRYIEKALRNLELYGG